MEGLLSNMTIMLDKTASILNEARLKILSDSRARDKSIIKCEIEVIQKKKIVMRINNSVTK